MNERPPIDLSVEVPGTPEEVWAAIATGPGITSWFVPTRLDGRPGGEVAMDFGTYGSDTAEVTAWEPPRRLRYEGEGERGLAYEWLVEARDGGTCIVRLVNSGFGEGADWDGEYDGMAEGWQLFLENLHLQLAHFAGRRARSAIPSVSVPGPNAAAWSALCRELGVDPDRDEGGRLEVTGAELPPLAATVARRLATGKTTAYLLLVDDPAPGTGFLAVEGDGEHVSASLWLYLYDLGDEAPLRAWTDALMARYPAATLPA